MTSAIEDREEPSLEMTSFRLWGLSWVFMATILQVHIWRRDHCIVVTVWMKLLMFMAGNLSTFEQHSFHS